MSEPMNLNEVKKVIDCSIYNPTMRKDAKDFVDGLVTELALRTQAQRDALAVVDAARELVESFTLMNDAGWWQPKKDVSMAERDSKISAVYAALAALPPVPDSGERE